MQQASLPRLTPYYRPRPEIKSRKVAKWQFASVINRKDGLPIKQWLPASEVAAAASAPKPSEEPASRDAIPITLPPVPPAGWNQQELDMLVQLAEKFDYRWPLVADRWPFPGRRTTLELKSQFYAMAVFAEQTFDFPSESKRLNQLDKQFKRTRESEETEIDLRAKIKTLDRNLGITPQSLETKLEQAAAQPDDRIVFLRSSRLDAHAHPALGLGQKTSERIVETLQLLDVSSRPIPTIAVCDAHDALRRDIVRLMAVKRQIRKAKKALERKDAKGHSPAAQGASGASGLPGVVISGVSPISYDPSAPPVAVSQELKRKAGSQAAPDSSKKGRH